jgi:3-dehydroquinate dehydratase type I
MSKLLCGCVVERERKDVIASIREAQERGADLVELRIDQLENPEDAVDIITSSPLPVIATCRREKDGGIEIEEESRAALLRDVISAGAAYVDLESDMEAATFDALAIIAREKNCKIICSFHDFEKTPDNLEAIVEKLLAKGDMAKLVTTSQSVEDCHQVLGLLAKDINLIAFCMGEGGRFTRIVSLLYGSPIGYCKIKGEVAKGQYSIGETKDLLRRLG